MAEKNIIPEKGRTIKLPNGKTVSITDSKPIQLEAGKTITLADGTQVSVQNLKGVQVSGPPRNIKIQTDKMPHLVTEDKEVSEGSSPSALNLEEKSIVFADGSDVRLREENVQEILTAVPNWMIRWGNTLFCSLVILLLLLAWMVKYPEIVSTKVTLLNKFPGQEVQLEKPARIENVLVANGDAVAEGDLLLVLENNADYKDILQLNSMLDKVQINSKSFDCSFHQLPALVLGDIQAPFAKFEDSYLLYQSNKKRIEAAKNKIYNEESDGIEDFAETGVETDTKLFRQLLDDYHALKVSIDQWSQKFTIKSSIGGKVLAVDIQKGQLAEPDKSLLKIDSKNPPEYIALLQIPPFNSGKVKPDQKVLLKLDNYPEMEFGMLEGNIAKVKESKKADGIGYIAEVSLSKDLVTSYDKKIKFDQNLTGTGEIIVKQSRLLEQFLSSINR